jgi:hypothetical protein
MEIVIRWSLFFGALRLGVSAYAEKISSNWPVEFSQSERFSLEAGL